MRLPLASLVLRRATAAATPASRASAVCRATACRPMSTSTHFARPSAANGGRWAAAAGAATGLGALGGYTLLSNGWPPVAFAHEKDHDHDQDEASESDLEPYNQNQEDHDADADDNFRGGVYKDGLTDYTRAQVAENNGQDDKPAWVMYKNGVYDVTEFIEAHPGGDKILLALGSSVDPFWAVFQNHMAGHVHHILEEMRIGNVDPKDAAPVEDDDAADPYHNDPRAERNPMQLVRNKKPYCAEPPELILTNSFITPTEIHYTRCHLPVPDVDPNEYVLEIELPNRTFYLTLHDLKTRFPRAEIMSTLQCIGNRGQAAKKQKQVGTFYGTAIGNSMWAGVRLRDVLMWAGLDGEGEMVGEGQLHFIHTYALDNDPNTGEPYAGCIPMEKAIAKHGDTLLAYEMNGKPIPRDHGFPVRLIAPGYAGVRNTKWVKKIVAAKEESPSSWWKLDMQGVGQRIMEWPVQSYIIYPRPKQKIDKDEDTIECSGYAYSGGGRRIARVEVSVDDGNTWTEANLQQSDQALYRTWAWTLWNVDIPVPQNMPSGGKLEVMCRAIDVSFNSQPRTALKKEFTEFGIVNNTQHRVKVDIQPRPQAIFQKKTPPAIPKVEAAAKAPATASASA